MVEQTFRREVLVQKYRDGVLITGYGGGYEYVIDYEYKERLSPSDNVYAWERRAGAWYKFVDGFWSREDYGDPDKPPRSYFEALKYRSCSSSLYSLDKDPNYTEEQKAKIRSKQAAKKAEQEKENAQACAVILLMILIPAILVVLCAWLKANG